MLPCPLQPCLNSEFSSLGLIDLMQLKMGSASVIVPWASIEGQLCVCGGDDIYVDDNGIMQMLWFIYSYLVSWNKHVNCAI